MIVCGASIRECPLGMIGIFNRSHYEEALVVRVHQHLSKEQLKQRFRQFNDFEQLLIESGTTILKFFLHVSREEQRRRLQRRLDDPRRRWKITENDFKERHHWSAYQEAYEEGMAFASGTPELDAETNFSTWLSPSTHTKGSLSRSVSFSECLES